MRIIVLTSKRMSRGMAGSKLRLFFLEPVAEDCLAELFFDFFTGEGSLFFPRCKCRSCEYNRVKG
jgi:hypothetical protein